MMVSAAHSGVASSAPQLLHFALQHIELCMPPTWPCSRKQIFIEALSCASFS